MRDNNVSLFTVFDSRPDAVVRLYCFPCAGGGPTNFSEWHKQLPAEIELHALDLPGRGRRIDEPMFKKMPLLVDEIVKHIVAEQDKPIAFFGHSIGAWLSLESALVLKDMGNVSPLVLFTAAAIPPTEENARNYQTISDEELAYHFHSSGAFIGDTLNNKNFIEVMRASTRMDIEMCATYPSERNSVLDCRLQVYGGRHDNFINKKMLKEWKLFNTGRTSFRSFKGDHFFVNASRFALLRHVTQVLGRTYVRQYGRVKKR